MTDSDRDPKQEEGATGPVPVRDLMRPAPPPPDVPEAENDPRWDGLEQGFDTADGRWIARSAGAGSYGTGRRGTARLVAVHFFRESEPDTPVREALIGGGLFAGLQEEELKALFETATPIEVSEEGRP